MCQKTLSRMTICLKVMDTNDQWIQERTGIKERRWVKPGDGQSTFTMGLGSCQKGHF